MLRVKLAHQIVGFQCQHLITLGMKIPCQDSFKAKNLGEVEALTLWVEQLEIKLALKNVLDLIGFPLIQALFSQ